MSYSRSSLANFESEGCHYILAQSSHAADTQSTDTLKDHEIDKQALVSKSSRVQHPDPLQGTPCHSTWHYVSPCRSRRRSGCTGTIPLHMFRRRLSVARQLCQEYYAAQVASSSQLRPHLRNSVRHPWGCIGADQCSPVAGCFLQYTIFLIDYCSNTPCCDGRLFN